MYESEDYSVLENQKNDKILKQLQIQCLNIIGKICSKNWTFEKLNHLAVFSILNQAIIIAL